MSRWLLSVSAHVFVAIGAARADTLTLHPTADARILSIFPTTNYAADILSTYHAAGNEQHTVLSFALEQIPADAAISSAVLRLFGHSYTGSTAPTVIVAYRVTTTWVEAQATWQVASTGTAWTHLGGDFVGTNGAYLTDPYAAWSGNQTVQYTWYELQLANLVNELHSGTWPNYGFGLVGPLGNTLVFIQREQGANPPELVVEFQGTAGDLNCDGMVDFDDINPFILALSDPSGYEAAFPQCNLLNSDCDYDGDVDFDDINPFVALLSG